MRCTSRTDLHGFRFYEDIVTGEWIQGQGNLNTLRTELLNLSCPDELHREYLRKHPEVLKLYDQKIVDKAKEFKRQNPTATAGEIKKMLRDKFGVKVTEVTIGNWLSGRGRSGKRNLGSDFKDKLDKHEVQDRIKAGQVLVIPQLEVGEEIQVLIRKTGVVQVTGPHPIEPQLAPGVEIVGVQRKDPKRAPSVESGDIEPGDESVRTVSEEEAATGLGSLFSDRSPAVDELLAKRKP